MISKEYKRKIAEEEEKKEDGKEEGRNQSHENSKTARANLKYLRKWHISWFFNFVIRVIDILVFRYIYES